MGNLCSSGGRRGQNVALKTFVGFFFPRGINMGYNLLFFTWGNDRNTAGYDLQLQSSDQSSAYETWACIVDTDIHLGGVNSLSLCARKHFFKNCFWSCESLTKWLTMWYWPLERHWNTSLESYWQLAGSVPTSIIDFLVVFENQWGLKLRIQPLEESIKSYQVNYSCFTWSFLENDFLKTKRI